MNYATQWLCGFSVLCVTALAVRAEDAPQNLPPGATGEIAGSLQAAVSRLDQGGQFKLDNEILGPGIVRMTLTYPPDYPTVKTDIGTREIAENIAASLHPNSIVYFVGYRGALKVCEYRFDPRPGTVTRQ